MAEWREQFALGMTSVVACSRLREDNDDETLISAFTDPEMIATMRSDMLAEVNPITPHYVLEFLGSGEAAATWAVGDGSVIQRVVTLPFSVEVPIEDYVSMNVVQIPATDTGVGCRMTLYSNASRDGVVRDEKLPVAGQTLVMCKVS
jgi:hypothetical protein